MSTQRNQPIESSEALREVLRVHDNTAIEHMRLAQKHMRESRAIAERIEKLDTTPEGDNAK